MRAGLYLTMAYIIYAGVIPLTFAPADGSAIAKVTQTDPVIPFLGYFYTRFDIAADDIIEKISTYAVLALMLLVSTRWYRRGSLGMRVYKVAKFGVCLSIPIEIVQVFIPVRVATITDLLLAAMGCVVGVLTTEVLANAYSLSITPQLAIRSEQPAISPVDELIQTLMDPNPNAPKEPSPARTTIDVS